MGGLITQVLLDRGVGRAGVAIQPAKPHGVLRVTGSMVRSMWPFAKQDRAPLLLVAGGRDNMMPGSVVYENFNRYRRSPAPTDFKVFRGRPHLMTVLDGWDDVAEYALAWTTSHTG
jgi:dienelactone hydrolase